MGIKPKIYDSLQTPIFDLLYKKMHEVFEALGPRGRVPFTQFLRPDGRRSLIEIERPEAICASARAFIMAGGCFDAEELRTGRVSLTAVINGQAVAIEVVDNGPPVVQAVDRLVLRAFEIIQQ